MTTFPTGKPHISFSEIKNWHECGWRHKLTYIDKIKLLETVISDDLSKTFNLIEFYYIDSNNKHKVTSIYGKTNLSGQFAKIKMFDNDFYYDITNSFIVFDFKISEDIIGNTYIYLIEKFASDAGKKAGEFFTPLNVSKLVALISNPKEGARICDPACGAGGLLIQSAKAVGSNNYSLFGMEVNGSTWALARMNMFLNSCDSARIEWCNTLTAPTLTEDNNLIKFEKL